MKTTDEARDYLAEILDPVWEKYVQNSLAGDFAYMLAKLLKERTIQVTSEDRAALMEMSKELQTQENHCQAFPYFWEPASEKLEASHNGEGEVVQFFDHDDCELSLPIDYAESNEMLWEQFLDDMGYDKSATPEEHEDEWIEYQGDYSTGVDVIYSNWERSTDHNPSLFLSDVQGYIKYNKHHLGRNPGTFARTVQRMPKMERLVKIIYRLNPQPEEDINHEAQRFVLSKKTDGQKLVEFCDRMMGCRR